MDKQVLITGGAGFIGSHLADHLLSSNYRVKILDNLTQQVHGAQTLWPEYLSKSVQFIHGDVCDFDTVRHALENVDSVFHFAASVGVGQSMYKIHKYTEINNLGTAVLLECMLGKNIERLIIASSMSVYGEGMYCSDDGTLCNCVARSIEQLKRNEWEPVGPGGEHLQAIATPETKHPSLASIYALTKFGQEQMSLMIGKAYNIPTTALRFFNVYGTRQALSNPYTGVLAIFASRLLNGKNPLIFEDGLQKRDFVAVADICNACKLALESPKAPGMVFNIGSGVQYTIREIALKMSKILGKEHIEPLISGTYRFGDIRHCFADISLARNVLGYEPKVNLENGLIDFAQWLEGQLAHDHIDSANAELMERGLTV